MIIETNKTTARIFPQVPDCENALFWERMERLVQLNQVPVHHAPICTDPVHVGRGLYLHAMDRVGTVSSLAPHTCACPSSCAAVHPLGTRAWVVWGASKSL